MEHRTRLITTVSTLAACAAAALPSAAPAGSPPFDVSVKGSIHELWSSGDDPISDGCGRRSTGAGQATVRFATAKPYRVTLDGYTGWHSEPAVRVTVERQGTVQTTDPYLDCQDPAPAATGCGARSYDARIELGEHNPWTKELSSGDAELFAQCPLPGDFGNPKGLDGTERFETADVLTAYGPKLRITRRLLGGCDAGGGCRRARKRTVIHFRKHVAVPFVDAGQEHGSYAADIDWTVTTAARFRLPPTPHR
jgi:hypothetical protein